jgi:hypothetical protein
MEARVRLVPWIEGRCSMYAVVRDGVFAMYNHAELPPAVYNPSRLL